MQTAEELWQDGLRPGELGATMPDWFVQVINKRDEEMRQECEQAAVRAMAETTKPSVVRDAILSAGKPTLKKGQLAHSTYADNNYYHSPTGGIYDSGHPVDASKFCGDDGIPFPPDPIFFKAAMSCD